MEELRNLIGYLTIEELKEAIRLCNNKIALKQKEKKLREKLG